MRGILRNKKIEEEKIIVYAETNKSNPLIPDRKMINRLNTTNQQKIIDMIEEDGFITGKTLHRIRDEEFAESLIYKFNEKLKDFGFTIENVASKKALGYHLNYKQKRNIKLFCTYEELCLTYYNLITEDDGDDVSLVEMIRMSSIFDEKSIENALYELFSYGKGIEIYDVDYEYKEIERELYNYVTKLSKNPMKKKDIDYLKKQRDKMYEKIG